MIKDSFSFLANYLWRESIKNLKKQLTEKELSSFSSNDYYYLTVIYYMERPNLSQVAEALQLTKPAISALICKLSKLGLIQKVQSRDDRRVSHLCLTEKGVNIISGDEELYSKIDLLIKETLHNDEKYRFVESLMEEIVKNLKND